ncbi:antitoxin ParD1/3/4 [Caulobacter sp. BE264]|uniref:hypothetical protein n=1 Tax=Caulobacter sp. BE264 TaxID=2817724 RepID=UPI002862E5A2|nr:hypothetical protein [Caulobacter sp. BE264]MDR7232411.1 antitoxin ParD1/3/4 [Caulobacter sp. BE264]
MNKPSKLEAGDIDDLFGRPLTQAEEDAWFEHNREAIGQLADEAWADFERGEHDERSFAEIIAQGVAEHNAKR